MRYRKGDQRGVSLLELVVALGILTVALVPFLSSLATASRGVSLNRHRLQAVELLVLAAEQTRAGLEDGAIAEPAAPVTEILERYAGTEFVLVRTLEPVGQGARRMVRVHLSVEQGGQKLVDTVFLWYPWHRRGV
ncbi:MAG: prepilin-type N-terminal cleavage/methylation domain-containing protein [Bacillota bacterium]